MEGKRKGQKLLAALAHPDDESFGMGGTLAMYAREGAEVYLICATRGEAGEMDEKFMEGYASIAERREAELRCAAAQLGLTAVYFLDYRDSGMSGSADNQNPRAFINAPLPQVAREVAEWIRKLKPQVVLTFDPIGGYRHPDHIHIQQATVEAVRLAGDATWVGEGTPVFQADRLYFNTIPRGYLRVVVRLLRLFGKDPKRFGKNGDIDLASLAEVNFPTHVTVNYGPVAEARDRASECHESQGGQQMTRGISGRLRWLFSARDHFMQAYPEPALKRARTDLFYDL